MVEYSRLLLVVFYVSLLVLNRVLDKKGIKAIYIILVDSILVSLFYGLRSYTVGVDTMQYIERYTNETTGFDYAFELLTIFLHRIFNENISLYFITINLITNLLVGLSINRLIESRYSIYIYIFTIMFPYYIEGNVNIIRQALAMSVFFFSVSYYDENKWISLILFVISFFTHKMFFPLFIVFLLLKKIKPLPIIIICFSLIMIIICQTPLIYELLLMFKDSYYITKLMRYISILDFNYVIKVLFYISVFLLTYLINKNAKNSTLSVLYMSLLICGALFGMSPLYSARYLVCIDFILVTFVYLSIKDSSIDTSIKHKLLCVTFILFSIYCFASTFLNALKIDLLL